MSEKELKDKVVKLLKHHLKQQNYIKIVFGDLESESVLIKGLEYGLDSVGRYTLGLDLIINNPTRKTIFVASPIISIFVGGFEIMYNTHWTKYSLEYVGRLERFKLTINSEEYKAVRIERKEDEK